MESNYFMQVIELISEELARYEEERRIRDEVYNLIEYSDIPMSSYDPSPYGQVKAVSHELGISIKVGYHHTYVKNRELAKTIMKNIVEQHTYRAQ